MTYQAIDSQDFLIYSGPSHLQAVRDGRRHAGKTGQRVYVTSDDGSVYQELVPTRDGSIIGVAPRSRTQWLEWRAA